MSVIIFLIILAILVLVHEFGHFIVAKKLGIRVDEFGLGFPPKVFSKKWGETLYTLNAIPFGGFVKIFGEDPHNETIQDADKSRSFYYKPKWIQSSVLVAGVTFNIIFAWLVMSLGFMIGMPAPVGYSDLGETKNLKVVVTEVLPSSPAEKAGLVSGDQIVRVISSRGVIQDEAMTMENVQKIISQSDVNGVNVEYKRGNNPVKTVSIKPSLSNGQKNKTIGIAMDVMGVLKLPAHLSLIEGAHSTWLLTKATVVGLYSFLYKTILFKSDLSQVTGPVGIAKIVGEATGLGFSYLLSLIAIISINLAVINLIPFPALDGGRLLFVLVEAIIRKPINPKVMGWANALGFALLMILMLFVTGHDVLKLL